MPHEELWEGPRSDHGSMQALSGVDSVLTINELEEWVARKSSRPETVFASAPPHRKVHKMHFSDLRTYIDLVRVVKEPKEIELIRKACEITKKAHERTLSKVVPGVCERVVAARFYLECIENGATGLAYPSVCAAGKNALILHSLEQERIIREGDCLMLDAGCEFMHYASDFTNTVPVGKVDNVRLDLLEMVNDVKCILADRARKLHFPNLGAIHNECQNMLIRELKQFGMKISKRQIQKYFPHGVSHWIGLDVHDCDTIGYQFPLTKGCVFSVEPGLYLPYGDPDVPKELQGLGCRFEDTVIID